MATQIVQFAALSEGERIAAEPPEAAGFAGADRIELHVRRHDGDRTIAIPATAVPVIEAVLTRLLRGERIAVLAEDQELSPNEAAGILGISRPLVVHRMDVGDLPFRYVGSHRRARLRDVLALKERLEAQQASLDALADDTEDLIRNHGL